MIEEVVQEAHKFVYENYRIVPQKSELNIYKENDFWDFKIENDFDLAARGIYVPESYKAYVWKESPFVIPTIFHEYYGHGLFVEFSTLGQAVFEHKTDDNFWYGNKEDMLNTLGYGKNRISDYEGFALGMESILSKELGYANLIDEMLLLDKHHTYELREQYEELIRKVPRLVFFSKMGFPRIYDGDDIVESVKNVYGEEFENIEFMMLYGSRKPTSDVDVFVCSKNKSRNISHDWLDIYELNRDDFAKKVGLLDISVSDPLFSGSLIYGSPNVVETAKKNIMNQEITSKQIDYNSHRSTEQNNLVLSLYKQRDKELARSYGISFLENAKMLSLGIKPLTYQNIKGYQQI